MNDDVQIIRVELEKLIRQFRHFEVSQKLSIAKHDRVQEILKNRKIYNEKTVIGHSLKKVPQEINVILKDNETWWEVADPDDKAIYLKASDTVLADIIVKA